MAERGEVTLRALKARIKGVGKARGPRAKERGAKRRPPQARGDAKLETYLRQNPQLQEHIQVHGLSKQSLLWMLKHGALELDENDGEAQRARAEKALRAAVKIMKDAEKLTPNQADKLTRIVLPAAANEAARFEAYLKQNPAVAKALASGKITREQALTGFRARAAEKGPSREQLLDAAFAKLLEEDPSVGRTPRKQLLPRLEKIIAEGRVLGAASKPDMKQRFMTVGMFCSDLIESGQVERFDEDLKRVHDVAISEIIRQARPRKKGADRRRDAERERAAPARDGRGRKDAGHRGGRDHLLRL